MQAAIVFGRMYTSKAVKGLMSSYISIGFTEILRLESKCVSMHAFKLVK